MSGNDQRIVTAYEVLGLSADEIAQQEGWDVTVVKAALLGHSSQYRAAVKAAREEGFTQEQEDSAIRVIAELVHSGDEHIALKAAKYVRDDKRGRLDAAKAVKDLNVTVTQWNVTLRQANKVREIAKSRGQIKLPSSNIVDVQTVERSEQLVPSSAEAFTPEI